VAAPRHAVDNRVGDEVRRRKIGRRRDRGARERGLGVPVEIDGSAGRPDPVGHRIAGERCGNDAALAVGAVVPGIGLGRVPCVFVDVRSAVDVALAVLVRMSVVVLVRVRRSGAASGSSGRSLVRLAVRMCFRAEVYVRPIPVRVLVHPDELDRGEAADDERGEQRTGEDHRSSATGSRSPPHRLRITGRPGVVEPSRAPGASLTPPQGEVSACERSAMPRRVLFVLLLLLQAMPLTVLAARQCRTCEHAGEMEEGVHCPLRQRAARAVRCHEHREPDGDRFRPAGCTCGERAAAALRKGDPLMPTIDVEQTFTPVVVPLSDPFVVRLVETATTPPDPPPRSSILL
jgi:hypothetical protein